MTDPTANLGAALDDGFEQWYRSAWSTLVGAITLVTVSQAEAEDVVSEALVLAHQRWNSGELRDPSAWAYRVAVNMASKRARRRSIEGMLGLRRPVLPADVAVEPELWRAVAQLPVQQRTAIALRYIADLTQSQIAEVMGVKPGTVAATLSSARAALKRSLSAGARRD